MKIKLRTIVSPDLYILRQWRNDPEIMARTRQWRMLEENEHFDWFENLDPNKNMMRMIECTDVATTNSVFFRVGVCGLTNIDWVNRSAEISIYIGDTSYRRIGIAEEVINRLKKIAFDDMNLYRIWAEVYSFNVPGINLFRKCKFKKEGRITHTVFRNGSYYDSIFFNYFIYWWKEGK
jgi:hypothetical protein